MSNNIESQRISVLPKRFKRWDLLLVDDHGKVISFHYIKSIIIFFLLILLSSILLSGFLYFLYHRADGERNELRNSLELSRQDVQSLQQKMHGLMVRLAEAQLKIPKAPPKPGKKKTQNLDAQIAKAEPQSPPIEESKKLKADESILSEKKPAAPLKTSPPAPTVVKPDVDISEFSALFDTKQKSVNIHFLIKNTKGKENSISGYIFVTLKENDHDKNRWLTIPNTKINSGKPNDIESGQFFKIRSYKSVDFRSTDITGPISFKKATISVFSPTGNRLFEQTHPVNIQVAGKPQKAVTQKQENGVSTDVMPKEIKSIPIAASNENGKDTINDAGKPNHGLSGNDPENVREKDPTEPATPLN